MEQNKLKLLKDHIITRCRNGRCYYDPEVKQALIRHAAMPGAAIAALAGAHGIRPSQLRRWVRQHREKQTRPPALFVPQAQPFVPVTLAAPAEKPQASRQSLRVRLPNGIELDCGHADAAELAALMDVLWKLPCSASTHR